MEHIFGNTFVCSDMNAAQAVAFHQKIHKKTVTLDGDTVDPAGIMSGGSNSNNSSILEMLTMYEKKSQMYKTIDAERKENEKKLRAFAEKSNANMKLNEEIDEVNQQINVLKSTMSDSEFQGRFLFLQ